MFEVELVDLVSISDEDVTEECNGEMDELNSVDVTMTAILYRNFVVHCYPFGLHSGSTTEKEQTMEATAIMKMRVKKVLTLLIFMRMG